MPTEWLLNSANMRWQLNRPKHVGKVMEEIRKCIPKSVGDWEKYYYENVRSQDHLNKVGRTLFQRISNECLDEVKSITEQDCINYVIKLVINRTFNGYQREIQIIYGQLQEELDVEIHHAPDEWDRGYNVDFFIKIQEKYIGLQIKPAGHAYITQIINEFEFQKETHKKFTEKFGGKVFYVISVKENRKKVIYNTEVIEEIKEEILRLKNEVK